MTGKQELIPITIKQTFSREQFPGRAQIDAVQHVALEEGRRMDRSVGDAMFAIEEAKRQLMQRIENYMNLNKLATTAKLPDTPRVIKLVADILDFIKKIKEFLEEVQDLVKGLIGIIQYLMSLKARIQAFLQARLNAIATLINQICNFNLPDLPSIPNIFGGLYFDGFTFPHDAFDFTLKFDANFAFSSCKIRKPNLDAFRNYPSSSIPTLNQNGTFTSRPTLNPPLPNSHIADADRMSDAAYLKTIQGSKDPYFVPSFIPYESFTGSVPSPSVIISPYKLPSSVLGDQIVGLLGGPIADVNPPGTITATGASADVLDDTVGIETHRVNMQPKVRAFSIKSISLEAIEDSEWDWKVVYAWLTYIHGCREARKGTWIPAFQEIYDAWITPGYGDIKSMEVPWHSTISDQTAISDSPEAPLWFTKTVAALPQSQRTALMWKLSYLEASLLDYQRSTRWDAGYTVGYLDGPTGADLDYMTLKATASPASTSIFLDSKSKAVYPSRIEITEDLLSNMQQVVTQGIKDIHSATSFVSKRASARFVYTPRAETVEIDMHSQFWKEFVLRWQDLQLGDAKTLSVACNYPEVLNSALNPLASEDLYLQVRQDVGLRDWTWVRGTPWLPTPYIPAMLLPAMELQLTAGQANGWGGVLPATDDPERPSGNRDANGKVVPLMFNASAFAERDDLKALSPNVKDTLIYLNQAYADALALGAEQIAAVDVAIAQCNASIAEAQAFVAEATRVNYTSPNGFGGILSPGATGAAVPDPGASTSTGGATTGTTTSQEADVFISPEDAITDIAAMAVNGTFATTEKPRLIQDMTRLDSERAVVVTEATAAAPTRPELTQLLANTNAGWSNLTSWMNALSPSYRLTSLDTVLPSGGPSTLSGLLTSYYAAFAALKTTLGGGGGGTSLAKTYTHTQADAASVWVVNHMLGRYPDVTVLNANHQEMIAEIQNISVDRLEVRVGLPQTGSVLCQ